MAEIPAVTCPECDKRFRPKSDMSGKKIKCPFCKEPFTVPAAKKAKASAEKPAKKAPAAAPPPEPVVEKKKSAEDEFDSDPNPYGVKTVEVVPRCPECANEMADENAVICLFCGYNTLTRERGKTTKTIGTTYQRQLKYLGPALGALAFVFFTIIFLIYYTVVSPYHVDGVPIVNLSDHESIRMWLTVISLGILWGSGVFCFHKLIEKPLPKEEELE